MLPHVDAFRAGHLIATLEDLARALGTANDLRERLRLRQLLADSSLTDRKNRPDTAHVIAYQCRWLQLWY